jgi:hypothetical protein
VEIFRQTAAGRVFKIWIQKRVCVADVVDLKSQIEVRSCEFVTRNLIKLLKEFEFTDVNLMLVVDIKN